MLYYRQITNKIKMGRKFTKVQLYRFPIMMTGIIGTVLGFYYTFSSVNQTRIKEGSRKFIDIPK